MSVFKPTPRQCAIHPCRRACPQEHATCDRHRHREEALIAQYIAHRDADIEQLETQIARRIALDELVESRASEIAAQMKSERIRKIAEKTGSAPGGSSSKHDDEA